MGKQWYPVMEVVHFLIDASESPYYDVEIAQVTILKIRTNPAIREYNYDFSSENYRRYVISLPAKDGYTGLPTGWAIKDGKRMSLSISAPLTYFQEITSEDVLEYIEAKEKEERMKMMEDTMEAFELVEKLRNIDDYVLVDDVIKAVDAHTTADGHLDEDISIILEEVKRGF